MKILVAVKQVPERDAPVHVASTGKWIDDADVNWTINEPDAYALEEALAAEGDGGRGRGDCAVRGAGAGDLDHVARGAGEGCGPGSACGGR